MCPGNLFLGQFNSFYALIKIKPHFDTQNFGCHFQHEILNGLNEMGLKLFFRPADGCGECVLWIHVLFKNGLHLIWWQFCDLKHTKKIIFCRWEWNVRLEEWNGKILLEKGRNSMTINPVKVSCRLRHAFSSEFCAS